MIFWIPFVFLHYCIEAVYINQCRTKDWTRSIWHSSSCVSLRHQIYRTNDCCRCQDG